MNQKILKLANLAHVKAGDKIWTFEQGYVKVTGIRPGTYPVLVELRSYAVDGKKSIADKHPMAFLKNPFEENLSERWMLVSNDSKRWFRRKVFAEKNESFVAWKGETEDHVEFTVLTEYWNFAKEIEDVKMEVTIEEIAEEFGVETHNLKIKFL